MVLERQAVAAEVPLADKSTYAGHTATVSCMWLCFPSHQKYGWLV